MSRNKKVYIVFILIAVASVIYHSLALFHFTPVQIVHTDILPFAKRALSPGWIYLDKTIEYPIIIGVLVSLAGKIGQNIWGYYLVNCLVLIGFGVLTTKLLLKLTEGQNKSAIWKYWVLAPSLFLFFIYNWDILAVAFSVIAFYFVHNKKHIWAAIFLALGFMAKIYPGLYLVVLLVKLKDWRQRWLSILAFSLTAVGANIFFALKNFQQWFYFLHFTSERGAEYGSLWKTIVPLFPPYLYDVNVLNFVSGTLFITCAMFLLWRYRNREFYWLAFGLTILFMFWNKVFSPQYSLWLLPFFVLLNWEDTLSFYLWEAVNFVYLFSVLFYVYAPHYYSAEIMTDIFRLVRLATLVLILVVLLKQREQLKTSYA